MREPSFPFCEHLTMHFKYVENTDNAPPPPVATKAAFGLQAMVGSRVSTGTGTCVSAWLAASVYAQKFLLRYTQVLLDAYSRKTKPPAPSF